MSTLELMLKQPWVIRAGWALVHFLWQGLLIAILFVVVRGLAGRSLTPRRRYLLACLTLVLLSVTPAFTFLVLNLGGGEIPQPLWRVSAAAWSGALPWMVVSWFVGVVFFSARLIRGWRFTTRLRTVAIGSVPSDWTRSLDELVDRMRVWQPVRLVASSLVSVPTVVGWLRPVILMPLESAIGLPLAQVRALLAHELAHVRRHDYLVNMLQSVVEAVLFYHPAVWWISEQIRAEREACCDDLAVEVSGDLLTYVKALADLESRRRARLQIALAADGGSLLHRVRRLIGQPQPAHSRPAPGAAWVLTILWLAGIGAATLHGAPAAQTPRRTFATPVATAGIAAAPVLLDAPPEIRPRTRIAAALLFDPFFAPPQTPAPPPAATDKPAKVRVQGKVVGPSQAPLKKAAVRLVTVGGAATADQLPPAYAETTNDEGSFTIENVPPGVYTLSASKPGFITGNYGARSAGGPGATLTVKEGADLKDLEIALAPQGTISGRVTDSDGEPVPGARIWLYRATYTGGQRQTEHIRIANGQTSTNVQGRYTFPNIPPGRYYLGAFPPDSDEGGDPGPKELSTYYPSGLEPEQAVPLDVAQGARIEGIDVRIRREKVYAVKGKLTAGGAPVNGAMLVLSRITGTDPEGREVASLLAENGRFAFAKLLPGSYSLQVRPQRPAMAEEFPPMSGSLEFTVQDRDLDGLVFAVGPGIELSGSFSLEEADWNSLFNQPSASQNGTTQSPNLPAIGLEADSSWKRSIRKQVSPDGTFQLTPVGAGTYRVHITNLPQGTYVRSMSYGSRDVSNMPLNLTSGEEKLRVVLSQKAATISGQVRNPKDNGAPMPGVVVTVWPKTPNDALPAGGARSVYSDQNGMFQAANLAPGDYYAAAWEEIEPGLDQNLDFLGAFAKDPETVGESSQQTIDVRLIARDQIVKEAAKVR